LVIGYWEVGKVASDASVGELAAARRSDRILSGQLEDVLLPEEFGEPINFGLG
jgi:hypothetical protein